jgi:hypothetical protein
VEYLNLWEALAEISSQPTLRISIFGGCKVGANTQHSAKSAYDALFEG